MREVYDPRELQKLDVNEIVTSDEEEDLKIQQRLDELEKQRQDLRARLELKAQRRKDLKLLSKRVEVPASPVKKKAPLEVKSIKEDTRILPTCATEPFNAETRNVLGSSTSYFMENFANSRKAEESRIKHRGEMLDSRVHTFRGLKATKSRKPIAVEEKEPASGLWVSRRYIASDELAEILKDIKILRLPKLFSKVRPPKFTEPDYANWVAVGILCHKSVVKMTSSSKPTKYFKMTITDFTHSLDVYVFNNPNVEKYYNLRVGDIIAILNADILPWRPSQVGNDEFSGASVKSFNLSIRGNYDCVLEIGTSRDLGFCQIYNKAKGKVCGAPINRAAVDRCDYHQEIRFRQVNAQRVELNGSMSLRSPVKNGKKQALYGSSGVKRKLNLLPDKHAPQQQDRESQNTLYFSNPNYAKAFFDETYQNPDLLENLDSKRRKMRDTESERQLQVQLSRALGKDGQQRFSEKTKQEQKQMKQATEQTIHSGLLKNIGFDPTKGKMRDVLKVGKNSKNSTDTKYIQVREIIETRKTNVSLAPSKADQKKRLLRREQVWKEHFETKTGPTANNQIPSDSSDSDLEIV